MQYLTIRGACKSNLSFVHYLIEQGTDVYIPVPNRIFLCTGEFETKAMFCTVTYFNRKFQNMFLF